MKIAVTYENGEVFQHFGKTESFKLYDVQGSEIISAQVIGTNGEGHEALAAYLAGQGVDVVICGGMGGGAQAALLEAGIAAISGAEGSADEAVAAFIRGELKSAGKNCDHHDHEEEESECGCGGDCGDGECDCEGECGGGCGGCGGGCGGCHSEPDFEGPNVGKTCRTHYRGTFNDGTVFDSSYERGEPLEFVCGAGMMIHGYDKAVATMAVGESIDIHLTPDEAYGMPNPNMIVTFEIANLPGSENCKLGDQVYLYDNSGRPFAVTVVAKDEKNITLDANHQMAGKELNFHIELVSVD